MWLHSVYFFMTKYDKPVSLSQIVLTSATLVVVCWLDFDKMFDERDEKRVARLGCTSA